MNTARKYFVVSLIIIAVVFRMPFNMIMIPIAENIVTLGGEVPTGSLIFGIMSIKLIINLIWCFILFNNIFKLFILNLDNTDKVGWSIISSLILTGIDMMSFYILLDSIYNV